MARICYYSLLLMTLLVVSPALGFPQGEFPETPEQEFPEQAMYAQDDDGDDDEFVVARLEDILQSPTDEPVDYQQMEDDEEENEPLIRQQAIDRRCYSILYLMAFTSGSKHAGSDNSPYLFIDLYTHENGYVRLYDRPGNDMLENKGDLWGYNIRSFKLKNGCIRKQDVNKITIHNGGNDGWKISSIMTVLRAGNYYTVLTADMGINKWIDGNSKYPHQITLTKVK